MSIKQWCRDCGLDVVHCRAPKEHKPSLGWYVSVKPSRQAKHRKKFFFKKKDAETFERDVYQDWQKDQSNPNAKLREALFFDLVNTYIQDYASIRWKSFATSDHYRLARIQKEFTNKPVKNISLIDGENWINKRLREGKEPGTINREITILKSIFSWAEGRQYLEVNPLRRLKKLKGERIRQRYLTKEEIERLLKACEEVKDTELKNIILVGLNTGFRRANIQALEAQDIQENVVIARKTKTGQPYVVPINNNLENLIYTLKKSRPQGKLLDCIGLRKRFQKVVKMAGLYKGSKDEDKVTLHTLRHTFASHYLMAGVPVFTVSKWLGHNSIKMVQQIYGHLGLDHHNKEIDKLPGIG